MLLKLGLALAAILVLLPAPGSSAVASFTGNFINDNDVALFPFTLLVPDTVALQTWGYGGGINGNGQVITAGGFEPVLQLYDAVTGAGVGTFVAFSNSTCPPGNSDPNRLGFCADIFAQTSLGPGDYILALTQNPNLPVGNNSFSAGFQYDNDPTFNNGFVGTFGLPGDGHWAVDILTSDATAATPEPSSGILAVAVLFLAGKGVRRVRGRRNQQA